MDPSTSSFNPNDELEASHLPLIDGLPDDIALFCLARVPRKYHMVLKCVSKRWRDVVCSEEWRAYRNQHSLDETWIYALCREKNTDQLRCYQLDPSFLRQGCWELISDLPSRCLKRKGMAFESVGKKLYLLGGCGWSEDASDEVYCYDATMNAWSQVASMSTARCYFGCETVGGKIYAIGGHGLGTSDPHSWDIYDSISNTWESHSDPNIILDIEDSVVMDGKSTLDLVLLRYLHTYQWQLMTLRVANGLNQTRTWHPVGMGPQLLRVELFTCWTRAQEPNL